MFVSDEVWQHIDTRCARVPGRQRVTVLGVVALLAVVVAAILYVAASGMFIHRLNVAQTSIDAEGSSCSEVFTVVNSGWFAERITSQTIAVNGSSARIVRPLARSIPSGGKSTIRLALDGGWCRRLIESSRTGRAERSAPVLTLALKRPWGMSTDALTLDEPPRQDGFTVNW